MNNQNNWMRTSQSMGCDKNLQKASKGSKMDGKLSQHVPMDYCVQMLNPHTTTNKQQQVAQLELKRGVKQPKLPSSKCLSKLMPRGLFFRRNSSSSSTNNHNAGKTSGENKLATTKSFPSVTFQPNSMYGLMTRTTTTSTSQQHQSELINRVNSASLIGLPRQSSSNSFGKYKNNNSGNNCTLDEPNLSPIVGGSQIRDEVAFSILSPTIEAAVESTSDEQQQAGVDLGKKNGDPEGKKKAGGKYKPFKNTTLVLRDVKNSIGLRMRAKQESQAFSKLTNELATPPTKLYSPFNIYNTPDNCTNDSKSKRKLNLIKNNKPTTADDSMTGACSMVSIDDSQTPKLRIALRHKKHLMQANKFTFDSPTGKFRETVKDVEHFQQCIEDISKAIRARDQPR